MGKARSWRRDAGRKRHWREVIRAQGRSGQSVRAYCRGAGVKEAAYALTIVYPDRSICDGRNGWIAEAAGPVTDPIANVGPFGAKPDVSMREGLKVDDLLSDFTRILSGG